MLSSSGRCCCMISRGEFVTSFPETVKPVLTRDACLSYWVHYSVYFLYLKRRMTDALNCQAMKCTFHFSQKSVLILFPVYAKNLDIFKLWNFPSSINSVFLFITLLFNIIPVISNCCLVLSQLISQFLRAARACRILVEPHLCCVVFMNPACAVV